MLISCARCGVTPSACTSRWAPLIRAVAIALAFGLTSPILAGEPAVNTAPVLDAGRSPALGSVAQDAGPPVGAVGTPVSSLVDFASPAGQVDNVTEVDADALLGIAVVTAGAADGTWFYSLDNGANWSALGAVAHAFARLLAADADTRLYFQPNPDFHGILGNALAFRAWDRTGGANGDLADTTSNGGATPYSEETDTASLTVVAATSGVAGAVNVTLYDSVVSLATNLTQHFVFANPSNGLAVVVAVTMTPYSSVTNNPSFSLLDVEGGVPTRVAVESGTGGGDGNWMDAIEGVDFSASLLSVSNGIVTNSIRFGIAGLGIRPEGGPILWTSPATTRSFFHDSESLAALDTGTARIADTAYSATLRITDGDNRLQLSNNGELSGQSLVVMATFIEGAGGPIVTLHPSDQPVCEGDGAVLAADAVGDPPPAVQWQVQTNGGSVFADVPDATNATLAFTPAAIDSGSLYRAVFTNVVGSATTDVASLSIIPLPTALITLGATSVAPYSATNTAGAPAGMAGYAWTIDNGVITSGTTSQTVTYTAGLAGQVTLGVTFSNAVGCAATASTNVPIGPFTGATGGAGVYVSDDAHVILKYDTNGVGSLFAVADLNYPTDVVFDRAGNLYTANYDDGTVTRFDTNGNGSIFAADLQSPFGLALDGYGNLFVSEHEAHRIVKIDTNGDDSVFADANLVYPADLAFDRAGYLYVANSDDGSIWKFGTNGVGAVFADGFSQPYGLAFDATGNLFVADTGEATIEKIDPEGNVANFATDVADPVGLAFDVAGDLHATSGPSVWKFTPDGDRTEFADAGLTFAEFVAIWPLPSQAIPIRPADFSSPTLTGGQVEFAIGGSSGANYVTQVATNLLDPDWIPLATNAAPYLFIDTNAASFGQRYYRALDAR